MEWISVDERLPESHDPEFPSGDISLIVSVANADDGTVDAGYYSAHKKQWYDSCGFDMDVTHWMPLPEPPTHNQARNSGG